MPHHEKIKETLSDVSTATITTVLLKKGLRNVWIRGAMPATAGLPRIVGPAFTMRFVPMREDLAGPASWSSPTSTRAAVESVPEGAVVVVDSLGAQDAGIFGDILCARLARRGVTGLVTDGVIRDIVGIQGSDLPVWTAGIAAPPAVSALTFVGWQDTIACGGVAVVPDDIIVADEDGAVVIPAALIGDVLELAPAQEKEEAWVVEQVMAGATLPGLYPMSEETRARYEKSNGQY